MRALALVLLLAAGAGCTRAAAPAHEANDANDANDASAPSSPGTGAEARLLSVGPRMISNQTSYPIMLYGEGLSPGLSLVLETQPPMTLATEYVDDRHLVARVPAGLEVLDELSTLAVRLSLRAPGGATLAGDTRLTVVNDVDFPVPYALERLGAGEALRLVALSRTTDTLHVFGPDPAAPSRAIAVGDRPRALIRLSRPGAPMALAVAHESGAVWILGEAYLRGESGAPGPRVLELGTDVQDLATTRGSTLAFATSHARDALLAFDLDSGRIRREIPVGVNPTALSSVGGYLVVANQGSEDLSIVELERDTSRRIRPGPKTPIIGGHTERFQRYVMGGKAARALVASPRLGLVFASTLGPNVGPNPERMEVSMNGGISVIEPRSGRILHHVSMLAGIPEGLDLDEARGLLYAADGATGRVVVFDAKKLAAGGVAARAALRGTFELPPPDGVPRIRPDDDFATLRRARPSLHFGPKAVRLSERGDRLFVLSRFSGGVATLDVSGAAKGRISLLAMTSGFVGASQKERRRGEVVYFTDLGNTRMTCDGCHPEGHVGGILFSKGRPIRIYRAPTCRAIRESPPYFTPTRLPSIRKMSEDVLGRNRFHKPDPTPEEAAALTEYVGALTGLPNPFLGPRGELPRALALPDGARGDAVKGLALFEGPAGCARRDCQPPPHFTADQDPATRGVLHQLGTPMVIPLRPELQDVGKNWGQPPPSLVGLWDQFPLFLSGAGGNELLPDGTIAATHPFALRAIFAPGAFPEHGAADGLTEAERNDLLAYLWTL